MNKVLLPQARAESYLSSINSRGGISRLTSFLVKILGSLLRGFSPTFHSDVSLAGRGVFWRWRRWSFLESSFSVASSRPLKKSCPVCPAPSVQGQCRMVTRKHELCLFWKLCGTVTWSKTSWVSSSLFCSSSRLQTLLRASDSHRWVHGSGKSLCSRTGTRFSSEQPYRISGLDLGYFLFLS